MKKQSGITLVALIITIIVMLILVAVTLMIALGENGIISKSKEASMETEKQAIYEVIVSAMVMKKNGDIDVSGTYGAAKHLLVEKDNKVVTPVSPTAEDQITDGIGMVILDVKGNFGTYTYTITKEKIIIGRGENEVNVPEATSYPYSLRIEPNFDFAEEEASNIVGKYLYPDENEVNNLKEFLLLAGSIENNIEPYFTDYDTMIATFQPAYPSADFSTPQAVFSFMSTALEGKWGGPYNTIQEFASDVYEAEDKKLMVNGEEATTGVTWDGNTAIYTIPDGANYNLELILDGKSANKFKASVSGYAGDLEAFGQIFTGKNLNELSQMDTSIYATYGIDGNAIDSINSSEVESGYSYYFDIYVMTFKYNGNAYGVYAEVVGSDILMTRVDLLTEGIKW